MYFLNAEFNYREMLDYNALDIDCVHTVAFRYNINKKENQTMLTFFYRIGKENKVNQKMIIIAGGTVPTNQL